MIMKQNGKHKSHEGEDENQRMWETSKSPANCIKSYLFSIVEHGGFPSGAVVKNLPAEAGVQGEIPGVEMEPSPDPWSRKWQPSPVFLPGEFHGQMSLAVYSP